MNASEIAEEAVGLSKNPTNSMTTNANHPQVMNPRRGKTQTLRNSKIFASVFRGILVFLSVSVGYTV